MSGQQDYIEFEQHETQAQAKYMKQMLCLQHGKRCKECIGEDEYGISCKYYNKEVRKNGYINNN